MSHATQVRRPRRPAFTLVEMLVSTALIMFMMYIIAAAFEKGIESFRTLKTAGDMQERLRAATTIMRLDLTRQHFGNHLLVSDQRLDQVDWRINTPSDEGGYFRIYQTDDGNPTTIQIEGSDPDDPGLKVSRANGTKHVLQFTVRMRPDEFRRDLFFTAAVSTTPDPISGISTPDYMRPAGAGDSQAAELSRVFASRWAEITYYMRASGQTTPKGIPLYSFYRRQGLLADQTTVDASRITRPEIRTTPPGQALELSTWQSLGYPVMNSAKDVTVPGRRFGVLNTGGNPFNQAWIVGQFPLTINSYAQDAPGNPEKHGGDLLLSNVVSFEVKALWDIPTDVKMFQVAPTPTGGPRPSIHPPQQTANADYPFDYLPMGMCLQLNSLRVFDTWSKEPEPAPNYGYEFVGPNQNNPNWNQGYFVNSPAPPGYPGTVVPGKDVRPPTNATVPLRVRMRAVQIKLRIWDQKSQQTRQVTLIQDL